MFSGSVSAVSFLAIRAVLIYLLLPTCTLLSKPQGTFFAFTSVAVFPGVCGGVHVCECELFIELRDTCRKGREPSECTLMSFHEGDVC